MTDDPTLDPLVTLQTDNQRRIQELAQNGMQVQDIGTLYLGTLLEHLIVDAHGPGALAEAKLDHAGRVSNILDDVERQLAQMKARSVLLDGVGPAMNRDNRRHP